MKTIKRLLGALSKTESIEGPTANIDFNLAVIGNLGNFAFWCWSFRRGEGSPTTLYLTVNEYVTAQNFTKQSEIMLSDPACRIWNVLHRYREPEKRPWLFDRCVSLVTAPRLLAELSSHDGVLTFGTAAIVAQFGRVPYVSVSTGSDLRELAVNGRLLGRLMARGFRGAQYVMGSYDTASLRAAKRVGLMDYRPVRHPIDTGRHRPADFPQPCRGSRDLIILHPSHQDWTYRGEDRSSTKGNDRFFRALSRTVAAGLNPLAIVLRRGVDVRATEELVESLGIQRHVQFRPGASRDEIISLYQQADVVADQFDIGAMGGIAREAMACAKPVMVYVHPDVAEGAYDEPPPVINVRTEDEIFKGLMRLSDSNFRRQMGQKARAWIKRYHTWEEFISPIIEGMSGKKGGP